jgi:hypothetical protein
MSRGAHAERNGTHAYIKLTQWTNVTDLCLSSPNEDDDLLVDRKHNPPTHLSYNHSDH